jgi:HK97 family phage portal protein
MKLFGYEFNLRRLAAAPVDPGQELINTLRQQLLSGTTTTTGAGVNDASVMSLSVAFACMRVIAEDMAATPIMVYRRRSATHRERATDTEVYRLLHDLPNPEMTAYTFKEMLTWQALLPSGGFAAAEIERGDDGRIRNLWPLLSKDVLVERDATTKRIQFRVHTQSEDVVLPSYNVLHIPGTTTNGYNGKSPATLAANVVGLALGLERHAANHFANGGVLKDYLKVPGKLGPEGFKNLRETWATRHGSLTAAQRTAILEEGAEYVAVMQDMTKVMPPEVRSQQVQEVCRLYRMPPHKVGEYGRATWSNVEQMQTDYYVGTLLPWFTRWEQACNWKLLRATEDLFVEFLADAYLRGDNASRMSAYATAIQNGIMTRNEARSRENLAPVEGGDEIFVPANTIPLADAIERGAGAEIATPQEVRHE